MTDLTLEDLLAEPCEDFTRGSCADPYSGKVPVSDSGTWNQYCGPCRLRYAMTTTKENTMTPTDAAIIPEGTRVQYRKGSFADPLAGKVRIVGTYRADGSVDMLSEKGDVMDTRSRAAMIPSEFWRTFEPAIEQPRTTMQYMNLSEVSDLRKYMEALADLKAGKNLSVADHEVFDVDGEPVGKITFRDEMYVFEFDYVGQS